MRWESWAGAAGVVVLLAGCGGGNLGSGGGSPPGPVPLATAADALRELGNTLAAARLVQLPAPSACSSGRDDITGPANKPRSFVYFSGSGGTAFTATVVYAVHSYSACVVSGGATLDGTLEAGATSDSAYSYTVHGSPITLTPLLARSNGTDGSGTAVNIAQSLLGTIETYSSGTQKELRSGLDTRKTQTPQSGGAATYNGSFSVGVNGPTFDVLIDSSGNGGNGSQTIAGNYTYSSSICSGGSATATTPSALLLTLSSDGSYRYATGGVLTVNSGSSSVTYTFSGSGATLSGSVSGSLSSSQVQQAFSLGSGC